MKAVTLLEPFLQGQEPTKNGRCSKRRMTEPAYPGSVFYCLVESGNATQTFPDVSCHETWIYRLTPHRQDFIVLTL